MTGGSPWLIVGALALLFVGLSASAAVPTRLFIPLAMRNSVPNEYLLPTFTPMGGATITPTPTVPAAVFTSTPRSTLLPTFTATPVSGAVPLEVGQTLRFRTDAYGTTKLSGQVVGWEERSTVNGGAPYQGAPTPTPVAASGRYIVVLLDVTNAGTESTYVSTFNSFRLRDGVGRLFDMADGYAQSAAQSQYGRKGTYATIQPGFTERMVFVFDVVPGSSGFSLVPYATWSG